jgi:hypothetical protein
VSPVRWSLVAIVLAGPLPAQGYRVQLDVRAQAVSFRGLALDSIPLADTVAGAGGGPATPDGFAVHCASGASHCMYFRPGSVRRGVPLVTTADVAAWGFGVRGLSAHGTARLGVDVGAGDVWSGTDPALQLLAGYLEYAGPTLSARVGRQTMLSRLGAAGFDGGAATMRDSRRGLEIGGYAGWGLARGVALPVTSPALNPLDDFQPRRRQLIAGIAAAWATAGADVRLDYRREVDPRSDYFVSERLGLTAALRPAASWSLEGGADYDLAAGWWGSAEARVAYATGTLGASLGLRRYRPHFDLWTIWGAFSPVPHTAVQWHGSMRLHPRVQLRARADAFRFAEAEAATPLVNEEDAGWRAELGATVAPAIGWTFDAGYHREYGPGAATTGASAALTYAPARPYRLTIHGATLDRPLEFRYSESVLNMLGVEASATAGGRTRLVLSATRYVEDRRRPDAAAMDWGQWRLMLRATTALGSGDDLGGLPPAVRRMPGDRARR